MNFSQTMRSAIIVLGEFTIFVGDTLRAFRKLWYRRAHFLRQCEFIGVSSSGIVAISGIFMGAVLGYQLYVGFHWMGAEALLGGSVGVALYRDLAAVMASIMVTGRAGAAIAAELATMRVTEQIDALEVMAVNPVEYLVAPRVMAGVLMMPILAFFFAIVASLSSAAVACGVMGLSYSTYWGQYQAFVDGADLMHCFVKSACFGLVLCWVACFCGFQARGGARAVGFATRTTVVASLLVILLCDYILTSLLPFGFSYLEAG